MGEIYNFEQFFIIEKLIIILKIRFFTIELNCQGHVHTWISDTFHISLPFFKRGCFLCFVCHIENFLYIIVIFLIFKIYFYILSP